MGKPTGFLEYHREENPTIPPKDRLQTFDEFHVPLCKEERRLQGARCMDCGVPLCQSAMELAGMVTGCPLHNLIPEWNHELYREHLPQALSRLLKTNNFPEFTGRVCPALCEKACILGQDDLPVTSHDNELFIIETAWQDHLLKPQIPQIRSGKKVAVIGSGPSGLAAADQLNHRGHAVTVFERDDRIGGLLMYGIPNMKLDKQVIARRQTLMEQEGIRFRTGMDIGKTVSAQKLLQEFDAVILCCGAKEPRSLPCTQGQYIKGVYYAVEFLKETTQALLKQHIANSNPADRDTSATLTSEAFRKQRGYLSAKGKHVVIVGGGDTGNDCIATVLRHGCRSVTALEMLPKPPQERIPSNPWPQWPKILKTDYGHEEAAYVYGHDPRIFGTTIKSCTVNKKNELKKITTIRGRFINGKWTEDPDSVQTLPCDMLLVAAGFTGCEPYTAEAFGLQRSTHGTLLTGPDTYQTAVPGIFTAGDMRRGQSLVVWAIAEGRACAREVDEYLMGYTAL